MPNKIPQSINTDNTPITNWGSLSFALGLGGSVAALGCTGALTVAAIPSCICTGVACGIVGGSYKLLQKTEKTYNSLENKAAKTVDIAAVAISERTSDIARKLGDGAECTMKGFKYKVEQCANVCIIIAVASTCFCLSFGNNMVTASTCMNRESQYCMYSRTFFKVTTTVGMVFTARLGVLGWQYTHPQDTKLNAKTL